MGAAELREWDAVETAKRTRRRDVSVWAVVDAALARAEAARHLGAIAALSVVTASSFAAAAAPPEGALFATEPTVVFTAPWLYGVVLEDFDGDSVRDILVDESSELTLYFMSSDGSVRASISYTGETLPPTAPLDQLYLERVDSVGIHAADLTGDGQLEVVLVEETDVRVLDVTTSGFSFITDTRAVEFVPLTATGRFGAGTAEQLIVEPSHDADPHDLQILSLTSGTLTETARLDGAGTVAKSSAGFVGQPIRVLDVNGDGRDDLIYPGVQSAVVRIQSATGGLGAATELSLGGELRSVTAGDFNDDARLDLALSAGYPTELFTFLQAESGQFVASGTAQESPYPLVAADLDGDGADELVSDTSVLWRDGDVWVEGETLSVGNTATVDAVEDWDGDGLLDILIREPTTSAGEGELRILKGQRADLSVRIVDSTDAIAAEPFEVTFEVRNAGPSGSGPITTTVTGLESSRPEQTAPECTDDPCTIASLGPGETARITVVSAPWSNTTERVALSVRGTTWDPAMTDNTAEAEVSVSPRADLTGQASIQVEDTTIFIPVSVQNSGPSTAERVELIVTLPPDISDVTWDSNPPATCSESRLELSCTLGELEPSAVWLLDIEGGFSYRNQRVEVTGDVVSAVEDPDPENNHFERVIPEDFLPGLAGEASGASDDGGCGCRMTRTSPAASGLLLAAIGVLVQRRRRASSCGCSRPSGSSSR